MADMPALARSARLGITRMRLTFAPSALRSFASVLPATMETTVWLFVRIGLTSAATASTSCGRTARKMRSAFVATSFTSADTATPYFRFSSFARTESFSAMMTERVSAIAKRIPSAILPAPKNPIFFMCIL